MACTSRVLRLFWLAAAALPFLCPPRTVFAAATYKVLHSFGAKQDGSHPSGPLLLSGASNLYGTTFAGGQGCEDYGCGMVYELLPMGSGNWRRKILYEFPGYGDGAPYGALTGDASNSLYGTTNGYSGGVFGLTRGQYGWSFGVLYAGASGPGLALDRHGNLYGEIGQGENDYGAIGQLSPGSDGWTYAALYSFCGFVCGYGLPVPPTWDGEGNMFGTTTYGGIDQSGGCWVALGCGVIFEITPNGDGTWTYHVLHRFLEYSSKDGESPYSGLVMDKSGNFYGATWVGGAFDHGTVFKLSNVNGKWKETILYDFPNCALGCMVQGTLALDKYGNLYGTAAGGTGNCGYACGVVFKLSPQTNGKWKYSVVLDLNPETGGVQPYYGVILDDKGHMFGVTSRGGKYGGGTAFEITP